MKRTTPEPTTDQEFIWLVRDSANEDAGEEDVKIICACRNKELAIQKAFEQRKKNILAILNNEIVGLDHHDSRIAPHEDERFGYEKLYRFATNYLVWDNVPNKPKEYGYRFNDKTLKSFSTKMEETLVKMEPQCYAISEPDDGGENWERIVSIDTVPLFG